jgi:hypothetical protein
MGPKFIRDVLLVPDLKQNLLSVGQLVNNGYAVHFEDGGCKIFDRKDKNKIIARIQMEKSRSFPLRISYGPHLAQRNEVIKPREKGDTRQEESSTRQKFPSSSGLNPSANRRTTEGSTISESLPKQVRSLSEIYESSNFSFVEPQILEEARKDKNYIIEKNNTPKLSNQSKYREVIGDKYIYKTRLNPGGEVKNYKARLMTKGFKQEPGINYWKTYAPMRSLEKRRSHQFGVKSAFQNDYLDKENYMKQSHGSLAQGGENRYQKKKNDDQQIKIWREWNWR